MSHRRAQHGDGPRRTTPPTGQPRSKVTPPTPSQLSLRGTATRSRQSAARPTLFSSRNPPGALKRRSRPLLAPAGPRGPGQDVFSFNASPPDFSRPEEVIHLHGAFAKLPPRQPPAAPFPATHPRLCAHSPRARTAPTRRPAPAPTAAEAPRPRAAPPTPRRAEPHGDTRSSSPSARRSVPHSPLRRAGSGRANGAAAGGERGALMSARGSALLPMCRRRCGSACPARPGPARPGGTARLTAARRSSGGCGARTLRPRPRRSPRAEAKRRAPRRTWEPFGTGVLNSPRLRAVRSRRAFRFNGGCGSVRPWPCYQGPCTCSRGCERGAGQIRGLATTARSSLRQRGATLPGERGRITRSEPRGFTTDPSPAPSPGGSFRKHLWEWHYPPL